MRDPEKVKIEMGNRRRIIIAEGFRLFSEKGIGMVSMQEIAHACDLGVATLYRYFNTKLDLVIAIGTHKWEEYSRVVNKVRGQLDLDAMTALEKFELYLDLLVELYRNHKDLLRFNQDFNNYVQQEGATGEQLQPYFSSISAFGDMFHNLYEKGRLDKTIRTHQDEKKMFAVTSHLLMAVGVRYATGILYSTEDEQDKIEEINLLRQMILNEYRSA